MRIEEYKKGLEEHQKYLEAKKDYDTLLKYQSENENHIIMSFRQNNGVFYSFLLEDEEVEMVKKRLERTVIEKKKLLLEKYNIEVEE